MEHRRERNSLLFENRFISVRKFTLQRGDHILLHSGRNRVLFFMSEAHLKIMEPPVAKDLYTEKESVLWHDHTDFLIRNMDQNTAELVIFSLIESAEKLTHDLTQVPLTDQLEKIHMQIKPDNPAVSVLKVRLKARQRFPSHPGVRMILFALSPYTIRYIHEQLGEISKTVKVGDILCHGSDVSSIENLGQNTLTFLVLVLKSPSFESISL